MEYLGRHYYDKGDVTRDDRLALDVLVSIESDRTILNELKISWLTRPRERKSRTPRVPRGKQEISNASMKGGYPLGVLVISSHIVEYSGQYAS